MARQFSFASWNIQHFYGKPDRFDRVVDELQAVGTPDVFGIFEVRSTTTVMNEFMSRMPTHQFFITRTAKSPIDTLVGVNRNFPAFYEQRDELTAGMPSLRPGASVRITANGSDYTLLFVHLKAFDKPVAWGLRDDMVYHIRRFKNKLDDEAGQDANFIAIGDYNAVGLDVTYETNDMDPDREMARYARVLRVKRMSLVPKDHDLTLWSGTGDWRVKAADADHLFASNHLDIRGIDVQAGVSVHGWPTLDGDDAKRAWVKELSDHALLYGEVHD